MRNPQQLLHSRTRVRDRYALMPLEGYPLSRLPEWRGAEARILAAPALGAEFAQYLINLNADGGTAQVADDETETFVFVLSGEITLRADADSHLLSQGGYALVPHYLSLSVDAAAKSQLLLLRKLFEPAEGLELPTLVVGSESTSPRVPYLGNEGALLQTLIPDELPYDMAMNIFTFAPGQSLPVVETHVMEHGLYFMEGKGLYYLDDEWMEVEADDFIWMGPFVPQSFYATGPTPARYIYYKNVNRDVLL